MERTEIIKTILELDNFFIIEFNKFMNKELQIDDLCDMNLLSLKPDRFYLVESLKEQNWDQENDIKTYVPETRVVYKLRSKEAAKYGEGHQIYYDRCIKTFSIENSFLSNPEAFKERVLKQFYEAQQRVS